MKLNNNGEYMPYYGWTVVCNVQDNLNFIEHFLNNSEVLRKYLSPLPASSYHVTIHGIWSNGIKPLPQQKEWVANNLNNFEQEQFYKDAKKVGKPCDENSIFKLLKELQIIINNSEWSPPKLYFDRIYYTGHTLGISFKDCSDLNHINNLRVNLMNHSGVNDRMGHYHMTLAYAYKQINEADIQQLNNEINTLISGLPTQTFTLDKAFVARFKDMTEFEPCFE